MEKAVYIDREGNIWIITYEKVSVVERKEMGGVAECFGDAKMVIPADTYPQLVYQNYLLMLSMQGFKSLAAAQF